MKSILFPSTSRSHQMLVKCLRMHEIISSLERKWVKLHTEKGNTNSLSLQSLLSLVCMACVLNRHFAVLFLWNNTIFSGEKKQRIVGGNISISLNRKWYAGWEQGFAMESLNMAHKFWIWNSLRCSCMVFVYWNNRVCVLHAFRKYISSDIIWILQRHLPASCWGFELKFTILSVSLSHSLNLLVTSLLCLFVRFTATMLIVLVLTIYTAHAYYSDV